MLLQFKNVFTFIYNVIPPYMCKHKIELQLEAKPMKQMRYILNLNYVAKVKEEIEKYLEDGLIYLVDKT